MSRIDLHTFIDSGLGQQAPADSNAQARGQLGQSGVVLEWESDMLANAAEEISMHMAGKAENRHRHERKKDVLGQQTVMQAQAINNYLLKAGQAAEAEKIKALCAQLLQGSSSPGKLVREHLGNSTSQYLALQYALGQGEQEGASQEVLERLREAIDDLEMAHGPAIRADLNTIEAAADGDSPPAEVQRFQQTYQDVVLGEASIHKTLDVLLERHGEQGLRQGLERLQKALGLDVTATRPSTDCAHLQSLMQDLYQLSVVETILESCDSLLHSLSQKHGVQLESPIALLREMVSISNEQWVSHSRLGNLAHKFAGDAAAPQITLLQAVKGMLRDMPTPIFKDSDQRTRTFNAVQEALDIAIDREEDY
ncbi:type III secretion system gatekeeper subunit SctW [Lampropedia aestuarii]|uniref:type III secretion system gatekeeper subunit SctW n=1 Tax=Lampropedia aestuarii TaxID=2562762 RepID=UPI0024692872|nr:type III secretion system gatekeeper subunit SctW [Lampropedia aestuarii]MDH5857324.1 type III secretion system gatekeeper subunit SctW [Lampropedia aestuarii]